MIKGINFEKLIPSKIVRDNMDLSMLDDVAVATLIEHKYLKRDEKMKMFEIVMNQTDNEALKKEIKDYLMDEKYMYDILSQKNDGNYTYVLMIEEVNDKYCYGCFHEFDDAYRCAVQAKECCRIEKRPVLGLGDNKVYSESELGKKSFIDGGEIGTVQICGNGEISYIWLRPHNYKQDPYVESLLCSYVDIYNPFDRGDIVTKAEDKSYVGVVATTKAVWNEEMERIKKRDPDNMFNPDFTDEVVIVDEISEEGYVSHDHICPTELEFANLEDYDSDLVQFLEAVSSTEKNDYSIQWMMMCYDKLAGRRQE